MRKYRRLTRADRLTIERRLEQQKSQIEIAEELGVNKSSISREISRNKALHSPYRWRGAQAKAERDKRQIQFYKRKIEGPLEELVIQWLGDRLSPQQISNRLVLEKARWSVSHETIYKWVYFVAPNFKICLRWKNRKRQRRIGLPRRGIQSSARKMIDERSEQANMRSELGHWERDLLMGQMSGPALLVIQDRASRLVIIRKVLNKTCAEVNRVTIEALKPHKVLSMTNDNGFEFIDYESLESELNAPVFFCHPYTSSERGTVENTNGLIRQYFPKGHNFSKVSEEDIQFVEDAINQRPRKTFDYRCAQEVHEGTTLKFVLSEETYRRRARSRERASYLQDIIRETQC